MAWIERRRKIEPADARSRSGDSVPFRGHEFPVHGVYSDRACIIASISGPFKERYAGSGSQRP